jgi:hypothetical protein
MSLHALLGSPKPCVECQANGEPATAQPGSDLCAFHIGVALSYLAQVSA